MSSEMWQQVLDAQPTAAMLRFYRQLQKTRRRAIPIFLNGRAQLVRRAVVRDYVASRLGVGNKGAK